MKTLHLTLITMQWGTAHSPHFTDEDIEAGALLGHWGAETWALLCPPSEPTCFLPQAQHYPSAPQTLFPVLLYNPRSRSLDFMPCALGGGSDECFSLPVGRAGLLPHFSLDEVNVCKSLHTLPWSSL